MLKFSESFSPDILPKDVKELLKDVYRTYGQYSAGRLRDMTRLELPWIEAFDENNPNTANIISVDSMYRFYSDMYENERKKEPIIQSDLEKVEELICRIFLMLHN